MSATYDCAMQKVTPPASPPEVLVEVPVVRVIPSSFTTQPWGTALLPQTVKKYGSGGIYEHSAPKSIAIAPPPDKMRHSSGTVFFQAGRRHPLHHFRSSHEVPPSATESLINRFHLADCSYFRSRIASSDTRHE